MLVKRMDTIVFSLHFISYIDVYGEVVAPRSLTKNLSDTFHSCSSIRYNPHASIIYLAITNYTAVLKHASLAWPGKI